MDTNIIYGAASVSVVNEDTGERVETLECFNQITDYGLSRLLAPILRHEQVANGISIGNKLDAISLTEDVIPLSFFTRPSGEHVVNNDWFKSVEYGTAYRPRFAKATWSASFSHSDIDTGAVINHLYLTYTDPAGVRHALTTLKLKKDGADWTYTHAANNRIDITYQIFISIDIDQPGADKLFTFIDNPANLTYLHDGYSPTSISNYDVLTPETSYIGRTQYGESTIKSLGGALEQDGRWKQRYQINWRVGNNDTAVVRLGLIDLRIGKFSSGNNYELSLKVKRVTGIDLTPRPVTSITYVADIPYNGYTGQPSDSAKITAPPYQWVDIFYGELFLRSVYINGTGEAIVDGRFTNEALGWENYPVFKSGSVLRFVSRNVSGSSVEVSLQTPDKLGEDLVAIWWLDETTVRAVSRLNDRIDIQWDPDYLARNNYGNWTDSGTFGICTTQFPEDPTFYYVDITIPPRPNILTSKFLWYKVTDSAGNVWQDIVSSSNQMVIMYNYVPGITYQTAKKRIINSNDLDSAAFIGNARITDSYSGYNFLLSIQSGEIR